MPKASNVYRKMPVEELMPKVSNTPHERLKQNPANMFDAFSIAIHPSYFTINVSSLRDVLANSTVKDLTAEQAEAFPEFNEG